MKDKLLFILKKDSHNDGVWAVVFIDKHSVILQDVSCESHLLRRMVDFYEFRDNYHLTKEFL